MGSSSILGLLFWLRRVFVSLQAEKEPSFYKLPSYFVISKGLMKN